MSSDLQMWSHIADLLDKAAVCRHAQAEAFSSTAATKTGETVTITTAEAAVKHSIADTLEGLANDIRQVLRDEAAQ